MGRYFRLTLLSFPETNSHLTSKGRYVCEISGQKIQKESGYSSLTGSPVRLPHAEEKPAMTHSGRVVVTKYPADHNLTEKRATDSYMEILCSLLRLLLPDI